MQLDGSSPNKGVFSVCIQLYLGILTIKQPSIISIAYCGSVLYKGIEWKSSFKTFIILV